MSEKQDYKFTHIVIVKLLSEEGANNLREKFPEIYSQLYEQINSKFFEKLEKMPEYQELLQKVLSDDNYDISEIQNDDSYKKIIETVTKSVIKNQ